MLAGDFASVMEAARRGDERAIASLYSDANPVLLRYLRAREPCEAEDLASEIWIRLARQIPRFEGDERGWMGLVFLVARRCLNDHWKSRRRRRTDPTDLGTLVEHPATLDVEASGIQALADREALSFVTSTLSADQAEVILLRVVAGLDIDEVATAVGKRPATVRVLQHRALRRLQDRLASSTQQDSSRGWAPARRPLAGPAASTFEGLS